MGGAAVPLVQEAEMTAAEIRAEIAWIAANREHLKGHAGKIARALDIAREVAEQREIAQDRIGRTVGPARPIICNEW